VSGLKKLHEHRLWHKNIQSTNIFIKLDKNNDCELVKLGDISDDSNLKEKTATPPKYLTVHH